MKNDFTKTNLFSCPIYKIRIDPNSYDKEKIINDILYNKSLKNTRVESAERNCDIHHSYEDFDNVNFRPINYEKLADVYLEIYKEFFSKELYAVKEFGFQFKIVNYSAITEGQWLPNHSHLVTDDFASIHYLNFKNDHVRTCFHNSATFIPFIKFIRPELRNILDGMGSENSYFWDFFEFSAEEDDMLIFPSAVNHEVPLQGPTKEPRITISSNIRINDT